MPWPSKITRAFAAVKPEGGADILVPGNQYSGPYNKLLHTLFPPDSDFMVSPTCSNDDGGTDFIVSFEITFHLHPVLILEVNPTHRHLSLNLMQEAADKQIHHHLVELSEHVPLPVLYGISAIGTKLRFYKFERVSRHMTPLRRNIDDGHIPSDLEFTIDVVPQEWWDCDVLEVNGEQQLQALAMQITKACVHLQV